MSFILYTKGNFVLEYVDSDKLNHLCFQIGKKIDKDIEPLKFIIRTNLSSDKLMARDFVLGDILDVVSENVKDLLAKYFPSEVQFLTAKIVDKNNNEIEGFYVMNILNKIECLDMEKSIYDLYWKKVVPSDGEMLGKLNIVRSAESKDVVVSKYFKEVITKSKIKNVEFLKERTF